jgi:myosin heavy subunit
LQELEGQVDALTQQQQRLLEQTREAASSAKSLTPEQLAEQSNALRDRQAEAKKSADELATKLKGTRATESREATRRAGRHMQQAEAQLADKQLDRGAEEEQTALDDLEQARRELAAARRAAQQEQLAEKANALAEAVRELVARQKTVVEETERLSAEQQKAGKWTRPLAKAALNLGEAEQELADGTSELSKAMTDLEAIRLTLDRATSDLTAAASRIRDKQLDEETSRREQSALRALQSLADALAPPHAPDQSPDTQAAQQSEGSDKNTSPEEPVPPIAQLKLLRQLEADIGDRTRSAEARAPKTPPNGDDAERREAELRQLADDQQSVREATARLLERVPASDPTNDPAPPASDESASREAALSAMQTSFDQLRAAETGKPTQSAQQTAIESLDGLMKQWQQRAAKQQSLARSGQKAPMSDKTPNPDSPTSDGTGGKPTGRDSAQARNSSDRERTGLDAEGELRRQRQLREAVWGHLPPALREKMLNLPHDKSLPKYSEHIRRYYEALAEQD